MTLTMIKLPTPDKYLPYSRVAFMGPMCSGKTYLANILVGSHGYTKIGFADKLKAIAYDLYGITGKDGDSRRVLQELADDLKKYDKFLFVKHLLYRASKIDTPIVVDDLRFKVEADTLRQNGFKIIKVTCEDAIRQERIARLYPTLPQTAQAHRSEQDWQSIPWDGLVVSENMRGMFDLLKLLELE
jgi:AAA domain